MLAVGFFLDGDVLYKQRPNAAKVSMPTRPRKLYMRSMKVFVVHTPVGT